MGSMMASPTATTDGLATASDDAGDDGSSEGRATDADGTSATALGAGLGAPPDPPAFRPAPTTTSTSATTPTMAAGISHAGRRRSGRMGWAPYLDGTCF